MTSYGLLAPILALKSIIQRFFADGSTCTIKTEAMPNYSGQRAQLQRSKCTIWPGVFTGYFKDIWRWFI